MAWTDFYMQTTGNNLNAGSTTDNNAIATSTNGSWDITANRFIAAGGATPFLSVTVGMYASIYSSAATSAVFVSKITAVDVGGTYIEVSKTANCIGTAPTANATNRSCKIGGAWATPTLSALFSTFIDQPTRINVKAGSYSISAATTLAVSGTSSNSIWWRGYNTTPGDLDDYSSLTKPAWTGTGTGRLSFTGNYSTFSGLDITSAASNPTFSCGGNNCTLHRCRITNTASNSAACAISISGTFIVVSCCYLSATTTATYVISTSGPPALTVFGTIVTGGGIGVIWSGVGQSCVIDKCKFLNNGGNGIACTGITSGSLRVLETTFYGLGADAILLPSIPTNVIAVINCNFWAITGYGINSSNGTSLTVFRAGNDFRSCSSGDENGLGDTPGSPGVSGAEWGSQDEAVDPWTSTTDMTPRIYSKAHQMALPRTFEYEPYNTYGDVGAVTSQNTPIPTVGGHVARRT